VASYIVDPVTLKPIPVVTIKTGGVVPLGFLGQISTAGGATTAKAPLAAGQGGVFYVQDSSGNAGANPITVDGNGHTIDGAATVLLDRNNVLAAFVFDGTEYKRTVPQRIFDDDPPVVPYVRDTDLTSAVPSPTAPGAPVNSVQVNRPLGTFAGDANLLYDQPKGRLLCQAYGDVAGANQIDWWLPGVDAVNQYLSLNAANFFSVKHGFSFGGGVLTLGDSTLAAVTGDIRGNTVFAIKGKAPSTADLLLLSLSVLGDVRVGDPVNAGNLFLGSSGFQANRTGTFFVQDPAATHDRIVIDGAKFQSAVPRVGHPGESSPYGVHGAVSFVFAADANYVVTAAQYQYQKIYFETGALGVTLRTVTWPAPATLAAGYSKFVRNNTTATLRQTTGAGTNVDILTNTGALLWFDSTGVSLMAAALA
jgi:hypothetical protein